MTELINGYLFLKFVGGMVLIVKFLQLTNYIFKKIYWRIRDVFGFDPWNNLKRWAVVTGGTDGIGKAYAAELARRRFNICLISRNGEKLESACKELERTYQVVTKSILVDFNGGPEIYEEIRSNLANLDGGIGVLVNNVGMSYQYPECLYDIPGAPDALWNMINSNITSCTMMMKLVIPQMEKGVIINVSSLMAIYPMPMLAIYSACKAYVDHVSRATQYEYKDKGITIQSVLPSYVATKMSKRKPSLEIPSAKEYVASAIKTVGKEDFTYGYFPHKIRGWVHQFLKANMPQSFNLALSMYFMQKSKRSYMRRLEKKRMEESENLNG